MIMEEVLNRAIGSVQASACAFCHYITPNDTGRTGSHQAGFVVPKEAARKLFGYDLVKGDNRDKYYEVTWQGGEKTRSRLIYYGKKTRNECRITRFGRGFPWLDDDHVGDLLVMAERSPEEIDAWVLSADDDIDGFFEFFNLSPDDTNRLIEKRKQYSPDDALHQLLFDFTSSLTAFPETSVMALTARNCCNNAFGLTDAKIAGSPDETLLKWVDTEYDLFQMVEQKIYEPIISRPFKDVPAFVEAANKILNRRKSRAGKSLEHHLASIFDASRIIYEEQVVTEDNKKPDFIFPNGRCYHNFHFPARLLVSLAAKTTCKDRWRQVINEADRIPEKHLFTLQQSISKNQLKEMADERVHLVVPKKYIHNYPEEYRSSIWDLQTFISFVREKQADTPKMFFNGLAPQI